MTVIDPYPLSGPLLEPYDYQRVLMEIHRKILKKIAEW